MRLLLFTSCCICFSLFSFLFLTKSWSPKMVLITPTTRRPERLAEMTRLAQTLMHVKDIHWIVVEDRPFKSALLKELLLRSNIELSHLTTQTVLDKDNVSLHRQRNVALEFVRNNVRKFDNAVVYFVDEGNSYDVRLFRDYLPKVRTIGFWAVGLAGSSLLKVPRSIVNNTIPSRHSNQWPVEDFADELAGFAVNLALIRRNNVSFNVRCVPFIADCFLRDLAASECQTFGHGSEPREVLVWRTRTLIEGTKGPSFGYAIE